MNWVRELASRPGHEKVRLQLGRMLIDELGVPSLDVSLERAIRINEVRGRIDALLGRTVIEIESDLRRELSDAERQLALYLKNVRGNRANPISASQPTGRNSKCFVCAAGV